MPKTWGLAGCLVVAGAGPVMAHSPVPGIEGFYVGLLHPFSTPSQAVLMIGLGLLVGAFDVVKVRWLLGSFLVASTAGLIAGFGTAEIDATMFAAAFVACAFAALLPGKTALAALGVVAFGGLLIGAASIPDDGPMRDRMFTMSGSLVGANVGLLYLFGINHWIRELYTWAWVPIAFRVAAAWVGAIALVMLALSFAEIAPQG
ncbi:hypothetical protein [Tateyamaria pelophila]|uniref:hypothetical protein n=1 Tax=Tateyamaria pelophila TaxID=328415 RepID=UPI001CBB2284|nr:hypothetical protein [Tateyamaria pelophila]